VGQAYGLASAILSGLALLSVAASLLFQARQTKVSQMQAARMLQLELFALAYEHPDLREGWSPDPRLSPAEWRKRTYMNLIFAYLRMTYVMQEITDADLQRSMANRFTDRRGIEYWAAAREAFQKGISSRRDLQFFNIADQEYYVALDREASGRPELSEQPGDDRSKDNIVGAQQRHIQHDQVSPVVSFLSGGMVAIAIYRMLRRRRRS
jgi:hypothetical protein